MTIPETRTEAPRPCLAGWAAAAAALAAVALLGVRTVATSGVWIHLATGRAIAGGGIPRTDPLSFATAPDAPWINPHWLYDLVLYGLWLAGGPGLATVLHAAAGALAFALVAAAAGRRDDLPGIGLAFLLCGWVMAPQFTVSPVTAGLLFPAVFLLLLSRTAPVRRTGLALVPLQVLWTNMHPAFPLGPLMAILFAVEARRTAEAAAGGTRARRLAILAAALSAATLLNPYGFGLLRKAALLWTDPSASLMVEWISPFSADFSSAPTRAATGALLVALAAGFVTCGAPMPLAAAVLAGGSAFALIRAPGMAALCAILALPFLCLSCRGWARALTGLAPLRPLASGPGRSAAALLVMALSAASVAAVAGNSYYRTTGSASRFGLGVQDEMFPSEKVVALLQGPGAPGRCLNLSGDGGFLAWRLPGRKVFIDPRLELYGAAFFEGFAGALCGSDERWKALMSRWEPEGIVLSCAWPAAGVAVRHVMSQPDWALVYFDGTTALFVRRQSTFQALIEDRGLQVGGARALEESQKRFDERIGGFPRPAVPPRIVGAANVFLGLRRFAEAENLLRSLVRGVPALRTAPLNLGMALMELGRPEEALTHLEEASRRMPAQPLAWLWLGQSLERLGQEAQAQQAYGRAEAINPQMASAFRRSALGRGEPPAAEP
jgi:hypothetical protein